MLHAPETIVESLPAQVEIDRAAGVIKGVKLVGLKSANGRTYSEATLRKAVGLYEGARVNVDHKVSGRSVSERIGATRGVRFVEGQGIFGDAHLNPAHPQFSQIAWEAEQAKAGNSSGIGFSHVAECSIDRNKVVTEIHAVRHVDIVADPATTQSFFESRQDPPTMFDLATLTLDQLKAGRADLVEAIAKPLQEQVSDLGKKVTAFEDREKRSALEESLRGELKTAGLDHANEKHVPKFFFEQCLTATAEVRKALIEDRAGLVKATPAPPKTPEQKPTTTTTEQQSSPGTPVSEQVVDGWLKRLGT